MDSKIWEDSFISEIMVRVDQDNDRPQIKGGTFIRKKTTKKGRDKRLEQYISKRETEINDSTTVGMGTEMRIHTIANIRSMQTGKANHLYNILSETLILFSFCALSTNNTFKRQVFNSKGKYK